MKKKTIFIFLCFYLLVSCGIENRDPNTPPVVFDPGSVTGKWSPDIDAQTVPVHMALLPTGKVLYWNIIGAGDAKIFDPISQEILPVTTWPEPGIQCAGFTFMADGRLILLGGHNERDPSKIIDDAYIYDPFKNSWKTLEKMNGKRWYPTATILGNGNILVMFGISGRETVNTLPQVWHASNETFTNLPKIEGEFAGSGDYPWMFLLSNGFVFKAGPEQKTWFLDVGNPGNLIEGPLTNELRRDGGSALMYESNKIMIVGGMLPTSNTAQIIDLNQAMPVWRYTNPMKFKRYFLTATILPNNHVFVVNGGEAISDSLKDDPEIIPALYPEIWDSGTESWSIMAPSPNGIVRGYHSASLLLPDARIIVGGGEFQYNHHDGNDVHQVKIRYNKNFEIFSPPYLFKGKRPEILSAPSEITYGDTFFVQLVRREKISKISLVSLSAVTHGFDQNQRIVNLGFLEETGEKGLKVFATDNSSLAPPGYYMLFVLSDNGVPSVAKMVKLKYPI